MMDEDHSCADHRRHSWPAYIQPLKEPEKQREDTLQNYAFANVGVTYTISEKELRILQASTIDNQHPDWRSLPRPLNLREAHQRLNAFLHSSWPQKRRQARQRLWEAYNLPLFERTPDLYIKAFNDLDEVLFGGVLKDRVCIAWVHIPAYPLADSDLLVFGYFEAPPLPEQYTKRRSIILNSSATFYQRQREFWWGILIHEMLHAYIGIVTGGHAHEKGHMDWDLWHGPLFYRSCTALAWSLAFQELTDTDVCGVMSDRTLGFVVPAEWESATDLVCFQRPSEDFEEAIYRYFGVDGTADMGPVGKRRPSF